MKSDRDRWRALHDRRGRARGHRPARSRIAAARGIAAPTPPPVQAPLANPATNPVQPAPAPAPQQQPTTLPQEQPAPEQAKPGVAGTPQKPAGNPK